MGKRLGLVKDVAVAFGAGMITNVMPFAVAGTVVRAIGNGATKGDIDLEDAITYGAKAGLVAGTIFGVINVALNAENIKHNYDVRKMDEEILEGKFQEVGE